MKLRELLDEAAFRIDGWIEADTDLTEFYSAWESVFESTPGQIPHQHKLEMVNWRSADNMVYVVTRKDANRVLLVIPGAIFDSADPREAALDWRIDTEIAQHEAQLALADRHKAAAQRALERLRVEKGPSHGGVEAA